MSGLPGIVGALGKGLALINKIANYFHDQQVKQSGIDAQRAASQDEVLSNVQKAQDAKRRLVSDGSKRVRDKFTRPGS